MNDPYFYARLRTIAWYATFVGVGIVVNLLWRDHIAEQLGTDVYLYALLRVPGIVLGVLTGAAGAYWWTRRFYSRSNDDAPADGGACDC